MPPPPQIDNATARRIFLAHHGLATAPAGPASGAALHDQIDALGFVQIDSVNTVARAHDMILWSRRPAYRPAALDTALARDRAVFEHWTHDAAILPIGFFPYWRLRFARDAARLTPRWRAWQGEGFEAQFEAVLRRIADHGECTSGELASGEARGKTGWWDWHPSKTALEYLWRTGALSVVRRAGFRKVYDLTERVIPQVLRETTPTEAETIDWACNAALDRLGFANAAEIADFWALVTRDEARAWCAAACAAGSIIAVEVAANDGTLRAAFARPGTLVKPPPEPPARLRLLSPFDPALRDRKRAERLFGFHYRIEIYVPEPQRRYGYYVFPVLEGARLIGRIDVKAQRETGTLALRAFWPEPSVTMTKARHARLDAELGRLARFAGCDRITRAADWLRFD